MEAEGGGGGGACGGEVGDHEHLENHLGHLLEPFLRRGLQCLAELEA
jgi:hypothetical protein